MKDIKIFFSWQSDISWNKNIIKRALEGATGKLNKEYLKKEIKIEWDDATRGVSGAPDIVHEIIQKIEDSDIFIGDVTPIIKNKDIANSNVMFELGYAANYLGWYRIIMLFNTTMGSIEDALPFDINRNRTTLFKADENADASIIGNLEKTLFDAIKLIIDKDLPKKSETIKNPEAIKRKRDIGKIERIFSNAIHIPTWDNFFYHGCHSGMKNDILHFFDSLIRFSKSSEFVFYDRVLNDCFVSLGKNIDSLSTLLISLFSSDRAGYLCSNPYWSDKQDEQLDELMKHAKTACDVYKQIITHIKEQYIEIDLDSLSQEAWRKYKE